jgi:hypothetical protein
MNIKPNQNTHDQIAALRDYSGMPLLLGLNLLDQVGSPQYDFNPHQKAPDSNPTAGCRFYPGKSAWQDSLILNSHVL